MKAVTMNADNNLLQSGTGIIFQGGTGINLMKAITMNTHLPYTDGKNYISGTTVMRGGALEGENGGIFLRNRSGVNMFDDETTTN